jgi:hypothetical protein
VKWGKSPKYDIIAPIGEKPDIASSIDGVLQFMAQHSGLRVEPSQTPDLVLAVAHDIAAAAPSFRKTVEDFLQPSGGRYHAEIDAAQWEEKFRTAPRKCLGVTMFVSGTIVRAFGLIQTDAGASCANLLVGELFGLINLRKYHDDHNGTASDNLVATAIRTLYDRRVIAGASREQAGKSADQICR